jgi:hypothetical protein
MLGDIVKAVEFLVNALKTSDDDRRKHVAKEILRVHLDVAFVNLIWPLLML